MRGEAGGVDLFSREPQAAKQPMVFLAWPAIEPRAGQQFRRDLGIRGHGPLGQHQRVVAIDDGRTHLAALFVEAMHDLRGGRLQPLALDAARDGESVRRSARSTTPGAPTAPALG